MYQALNNCCYSYGLKLFYYLLLSKVCIVPRVFTKVFQSRVSCETKIV